MDVLFLSRLQFAVATYFHFLFVPLTLGLSLLVAIMQTKWYRSGDEDYLRMTKFWGKLFLINFAIGIVTGITLEFQFGTNWSRSLDLRGRHLRLPAGDRSHGVVLPGIHFTRLFLRLGTGFRGKPTWHRSGSWRSPRTCRTFLVSWWRTPGMHQPRRVTRS
jgi:hypothetical protein